MTSMLEGSSGGHRHSRRPGALHCGGQDRYRSRTVKRRVYPGYFVSSFAGFVPAEDPAITAMVVVEGTHQYGAQASAPVFATIARDALQEFGIPPTSLCCCPRRALATLYGGEVRRLGPAARVVRRPRRQVSRRRRLPPRPP